MSGVVFCGAVLCGPAALAGEPHISSELASDPAIAGEGAAPANEAEAKPAAKGSWSESDTAEDSESAESSEEGETADSNPSTASASRGRVDPDIVELRKAIRVFRRETERLGVREDGQGGNGHLSLGDAWHGRLYEYVRNDVLDAVPHEVVQRGGERNILRRNQFGLSVSGPAYIPKMYDGRRRTFFTFSYEGTRERVGRSFLRTIPTALQRTGDFSDLVNKAGDPVSVYDPDSSRLNPNFDASRNVEINNLEYLREPFPNNQVPVSRQDAVAQAMAPHIPQPNTNVGPFLRNNYWVNPPEENAPDGFLAKVDHNLFERHKVTVDLAYSKGFQGYPEIYPTIANPGSPDRTFSNRRLRVRETFTVSPSAIYSGELRVSSESRRTAGLLDTSNDIPAELGLTGVSGTLFPTVEFKNFEGLGSPRNSQFRNAWNHFGTEHSLTLRRGKHSWAISTELDFYQLNTFMPESPSGYFQFNDEMTGLPGIVNTGSSFASFLLGRSYRAEATDLLEPSYLRRHAWELRLRDEYEISPKLTASLSLNLDTSSPRFEKFDRQSTVDLNEVNPANGRLGALVFANKGDYERSFQPYRVRLEPRFSLAWSPTDQRDTVVRFSLMQYHTGVGLRPGPFATQGFSARRTFVSSNEQLEPAVTFAEGVPPLEHPLPDLRPDAANDTDADFIAQSARQPRYRWASLNVERRLPLGLSARLGGRISRGKDILVGGSTAGINAIPLEALDYRDSLNDETFRRSLRPYPHFQQLQTDGQFPLGRYNYEGGYASVEKRASHGLTFDFGYELIRQRDDYSGPGVQDYFNRDSAWAISRGLRPHRLSLTYVYELPFGTGKPIVSQPGVLRHVLGNWSVSGFTRWLSGDPIVLEPEFNNTGGVVPFLRVNAVPGVDPHVANRSAEQWFNPLAFLNPDDFTIGNVSRTHPGLRNPGWNNHDLAVTKRLPLSAERSLELMFQGFNFLNHGNWADPDAVIGPENARNTNAGRIIESRGGRVVQLGLRFNF